MSGLPSTHATSKRHSPHGPNHATVAGDARGRGSGAACGADAVGRYAARWRRRDASGWWWRLLMIKKTKQGYQVTSEKGKALSKPNLSLRKAKERLASVEMFKAMKSKKKG